MQEVYYYNNQKIGEHLIEYKKHAKENYKVVWKDFNLGKINPSEFEKIKFIGNYNSFDTRSSWATWGPYLGKKANQVFNGRKVDDVIKNVKSNNNFNIEDTFSLQSLDKKDFLAKLRVEQNLGLTWYKEKGNYHLQLLIRQYVETWASEVGGGVYMSFGDGIKLYNDNIGFYLENKDEILQSLSQYIEYLEEFITKTLDYFK